MGRARAGYKNLAAALEKVNKWTLAGSEVVLTVSHEFDSVMLDQEQKSLQDCVRGVMGPNGRYRIRIEEEKVAEVVTSDFDLTVEMIRKAFRGDIEN